MTIEVPFNEESVGTRAILPFFAWFYSYQTAVIERKRVVFPLTILTAEPAVNPRETVFINLRDTQRAAASEQLLVSPHCAAVDVITLLKKIRWYFDESNSVADP
jgi:hypothetical protein